MCDQLGYDLQDTSKYPTDLKGISIITAAMIYHDMEFPE